MRGKIGLGVRRCAVGALSLGLVLILVGCGGDRDKPKLGKVSGKVTYKGKPVSSGHIVFTPSTGKGGETGQTATGEIESDGSYTMTTFNTGDGAILGQHVVTVQLSDTDYKSPQPKADGTIDYVMPKSLGPKKYTSTESSPLRCTVEEGSMTFDIDLKD